MEDQTAEEFDKWKKMQFIWREAYKEEYHDDIDPAKYVLYFGWDILSERTIFIMKR